MKPSELINDLINKRKYESYLEVGLQSGNTFSRVICKTKKGMDPAWKGEVNNSTFKMTSDEFFEHNRKVDKDSFDIIFIDGLHEKEQVLKDINNALLILNPDGVILIHDCLPRTERMQGSYCGGEWTGDVWKAMVEVRKDSRIDSVTIDTDYGFGMIFKRLNTSIYPKTIGDLTWEDYTKNREGLLRVIKETEIYDFLEAPYMHWTSMDQMKKLVNTYIEDAATLNIIDVGSYDVNGSYKNLFNKPGYTYRGVDLEAGPNVDIVLTSPYLFPLEDNSVDLVISGQALEHIEFFWLTWMEIVRIVRPGGHIFIIAPCQFQEHKYPVDCWRFYSDGFKALGKYANVEVLEAFTAPGCNPGQSDCVGAFRKLMLSY